MILQIQRSDHDGYNRLFRQQVIWRVILLMHGEPDLRLWALHRYLLLQILYYLFIVTWYLDKILRLMQKQQETLIRRHQ